MITARRGRRSGERAGGWERALREIGFVFSASFFAEPFFLWATTCRSISTVLLRDRRPVAQWYRKKMNHGGRRGRGERLPKGERPLKAFVFMNKWMIALRAGERERTLRDLCDLRG